MAPIHTEPKISTEISRNFTIAKVLSILMVVAGHWFTGTILWIPVTFGLFIFAFSSAYFTSKLYGAEINYKLFWKKKLKRLGLRFWIISSFLSVIIFLRDGNLYHWHTLVHLTGLSGFLDWFDIQNKSSLGAGLWFFTLLLVFYVSYPLIAKLSSDKSGAILISVLSFVIALFLRDTVKMGHELWLTVAGFILGVTISSSNFYIRSLIPLLTFIAGCVLLIVSNLFFGLKLFNTVLIFLCSLSASLWLVNGVVSNVFFVGSFKRLEECLLEIYLIHTYFFIKLTGSSVVDFIISVFVIILLSLTLNGLTKKIERKVFS